MIIPCKRWNSSVCSRLDHSNYNHVGQSRPGVIAMKGYSILPKTLLLEPHHQRVFSYIQDTCWWRSPSSTETQSAYSTTPINKAAYFWQ